ncbi:MAG: MGMT family protein, partial [Armatimonadetes bacterium]|nr:MGMT family protein [Armatimonadota bacterium]
MGDLRDSQLEQLWHVVRSIPSGRVSSYGAVGRVLPNPATGYMVGRWMAACPADVPWWRVVNKRGELPINKRDPRLATDQQLRLESEGL